jgi:hypothetical protein
VIFLVCRLRSKGGPWKDIYGHQGIDFYQVMERNNLLIRDKHGKKISVIEG